MRKTLLENNSIKIDLDQGMLLLKWTDFYIDLPVAQKLIEYRLMVSEGTSYPIYADISSVKNSTKEARDFMASEKACEGVIAAAILVDSPLTSMIANFFLRVSKPFVPTRLYTDEATAKKWLSRYVKE